MSHGKYSQMDTTNNISQSVYPEQRIPMAHMTQGNHSDQKIPRASGGYIRRVFPHETYARHLCCEVDATTITTKSRKTSGTLTSSSRGHRRANAWTIRCKETRRKYSNQTQRMGYNLCNKYTNIQIRTITPRLPCHQLYTRRGERTSEFDTKMPLASFAR